MTNSERLLKYLKTRKSATSAQIYAATGIWRVSDAVYKVREKYHDDIYYERKLFAPNIDTTMIKVKNRHGEYTWVASYSLVK